jgi:hypothetical protein
MVQEKDRCTGVGRGERLVQLYRSTGVLQWFRSCTDVQEYYRRTGIQE